MLSVEEWASFTFSKCNLGDKRRTARLVKTLENIASNVGQSIVRSSPTDADVEGTYRLIRNDHVNADAIAEGGFQATAELAESSDVLLAIEDTTSLSYKHTVKELGYSGNSESGRTKSLLAHSVMLYDPEKQQTLGLIEQARWTRDNNEYGKRKDRGRKPYEDKESFKWETASRAVSERLKAHADKYISVCDREADIIEYLSYKQRHSQRFVVRAAFNRPLEEDTRLFDYVGEQQDAGDYRIHIPQRGGRVGREATFSIRFAPVSILAPTRKQKRIEPINANVILCEEQTSTDKPLKWVLLTSEPVSSSEEARQIVRYYEARWKIEDFHKVWKTNGTNVEGLRMQQADNMERMAVILAFAAMRIYQLKEYGDSESISQAPCSRCLSPIHWKLLWRKIHKGKKVPKDAPTMKWAYHALGRLGGWKDSKRNGRVGYTSLWDGWEKLEGLVEGFKLFQELEM